MLTVIFIDQMMQKYPFSQNLSWRIKSLEKMDLFGDTTAILNSIV